MTPAPRPVAPDRLVGVLADHVAVAAAAASDAGVLRVAVDGAPVVDPAGLADALVDPLRFERGRTDPDVLRDGWLDVGALRREVLEPVGPGGIGRYLPTLWDPEIDRATRASYAAAPPGAVLLLDGSLLLGHSLPFDLTIHLRLSAAALSRRTPADEQWTLPAYARYEAEVDPGHTADLVVRLDDPRHPAVTAKATGE